MKLNAYLLAEWLTIQQPTWDEVLDAVTCGRFEDKEAVNPSSIELKKKTDALKAVRNICEKASDYTLAFEAYRIAHQALVMYPD